MDAKKVSFGVDVFTSKKGNKAFALVANLSYRKAYVSFDQNLIAELLHVSLVDLFDMVNGYYDL